jgi:hypothetical protein
MKGWLSGESWAIIFEHQGELVAPFREQTDEIYLRQLLVNCAKWLAADNPPIPGPGY